MIDPEQLDSFEVLAHLKQLGYHNITASQLKDFVHDLKILIKYEQKCDPGFTKASISDSPESSRSISSCYSYESNSSNEDPRDSESTRSSELCSNCYETKSDFACDTSHTTDNCTSGTEIDNKKRKLAFSQPVMRPQTSFIRPWRLQPASKGTTSVASLKTDPVNLYHKYKELWALQKVPGEKSHSQLRWTIREKMLGQDPHPRPISQASGIQSSNDCHSHSMSCK